MPGISDRSAFPGARLPSLPRAFFLDSGAFEAIAPSAVAHLAFAFNEPSTSRRVDSGSDDRTRLCEGLGYEALAAT